MAKYVVSQEIMDILDNNTWRDWGHIEKFITDVCYDNFLLYSWCQDGETTEDDNERFTAVIDYVLNKGEGLFEVEKPVMYYFYDAGRMFHFGGKGSIIYSWTVREDRANMTLEEAHELYKLSKSEDKKIVDSNGKVFIENCADLPF
ncbi:hypothetical protein pwc_16 [Weissella phage PWc]|nr:hypothetical protein pwc_16 [Weissella phage PWc]